MRDYKYNVYVVNRFTGKRHEEHINVDIETVYRVQDRYLLMFWMKVNVSLIIDQTKDGIL